ncbi:MAG: GNAT family protein [Actinomycetes bacterium]
MQGDWVRLEPLALHHAPQLFQHTANDADLWRWVLTKFPIPRTESDMVDVVGRMIAQREAGSREPFAVIDLRTGDAVGSTSFSDISVEFKNIEIGSTFYGAVARRTGINTETKLLLMTEAFEARGCERVQIKADILNTRSLRAIERIGAKYEGSLRNHMPRRDGTRRDTVMYSIIAPEWPETKANLQALLAR